MVNHLRLKCGGLVLGEESDSWEPLAGLAQDVPVLVRDFCRAHSDDDGAAPLRELLRRIEVED